MSAAGAAPARRSAVTAAAVCAAALFVVFQALLWIAYYAGGAKPLIGDEASYQQFALSILGGGTWMPSSIWPPLQPILIAAIYATFGVHVVAVQVVQTILFVGCAMLVRSIWRRLDGRVRAANVAAALFLLNPGNAAYAHWLWPEIPHLFLVLLVFRLLLGDPGSRRASIVAGVATGLAILLKSLLSAFWPFFLIAFVRSERPRFRIASASWFVLALALTTAPALWHGWREFGKPMIADSSIYNLWVGLTDTERADYVNDQGGATLKAFLDSGATPQQRNAIYAAKVEDFVAQRGVIRVAIDQLSRQYFRLFEAKTPLVSQLPGPSCAGHLSIYNSGSALTRTLTIANDVFHALTLAGAAFGVACWRRRPGFVLALVGLYFGYQLALMSVLHVKARFLFPMIPFLCGFAGSFYASVRARTRDEAGSLALSTVRVAVGTLFAIALLFLAFAGPLLGGLCAG